MRTWRIVTVVSIYLYAILLGLVAVPFSLWLLYVKRLSEKGN